MLNTSELDALRRDESALRKELESAGARFRGKSCQCLFHDDRSPSAGIYCKEGVWKFCCQVCKVQGDIIDIRAKLNKRSVAEELRAMNEKARSHSPQGGRTSRPAQAAKPPKIYPTIEALRAGFSNVEGLYRYTHPTTGAVELVVLRYRDTDGKKHFVQASPCPGGFWMKAPEGLLPIYNRTRVAAAEEVVVVEGEKCAHALQEIGIVATTSPGGALKGGLADWSPLAGKRVYLWPDNDPENPPDRPHPGERTGIEHMRQVQQILQQLTPPPEVLWIDPEKLELPPKGDAADFVDRYDGWAAEDIKAVVLAEVMADAEALGIGGDYAKYMQAGMEGKRRAIAFPWPLLSRMTRALQPGKVMCWVGDPGCGKSLAMLQCLWYWHAADIKACVYMLEDERNDHLARVHAQLEKNSHLTDPEWLEANQWAADDALKRCRRTLEEIGRCIWDAPDEQVSLEMLSAWVEERAKAGFKIIIIDPVTAAAAEAKPWIADCSFIFRVKTICRRYGCSAVLVVHPRKGTGRGKGGGLDDMAGGAAYGRFSHTTVWFEVYDKEGELMVRKDLRYPAEGVLPNRVAKIPKSRNGPGHGKRIAFEFDSASLMFRELGLVEKN